MRAVNLLPIDQRAGGKSIRQEDPAVVVGSALGVVVMIALLYYASPNAKLRGVKSILPGAALAVVDWLVASAAFAFYVANFGSYDKTYGTFAGVIIFLLWLWITNVAILLGAELNAELERSREIEAGVPGAEREIQLEPRSEPNDKKTAEDIAAEAQGLFVTLQQAASVIGLWGFGMLMDRWGAGAHWGSAAFALLGAAAIGLSWRLQPGGDGPARLAATGPAP